MPAKRRKSSSGPSGSSGPSDTLASPPSPYSLPRPPSLVKLHERGHINPLYLSLSDMVSSGQCLNKNVPYIWILNAKQEIIFGVEKPWEHKEDIVATEAMLTSLSQQNDSHAADDKSGFGHATLSHTFLEDGSISDTPGTAFIAGELSYNAEESKWILNNKSGRFYQVQGRNTLGIQWLLDFVSMELHAKLGINVEAVILKSKLDPETMWSRVDEKASTDEVIKGQIFVCHCMFSVVVKIFKHTYEDHEMREVKKGELTVKRDEILLGDRRLSVYQSLRFFHELADEERNAETKQVLLDHVGYMLEKKNIRSYLPRKKLHNFLFNDLVLMEKVAYQVKRILQKMVTLSRDACALQPHLANNRFAMLAPHTSMRFSDVPAINVVRRNSK